MNSLIFPCMLLGYALVAASDAQAAGADGTLELRDAVTLAVENQPLLDGIDAQANAAREAAVAAGQLPDPQLFGGVRDLPIDTDDAYSFSNDSDTQLVVGVAQEFPRAQKRRLRGNQRLREADRLQAERVLREREIRRDVASAWLSLWRDDRAKVLADAAFADAQLQAQAVEIGLRVGRTTQADLLTAQLDVERQRDAIAAREQTVAQARSRLLRWIGAAANREMSADAPTFPAPPPSDVLLERVADHPELTELQARIGEADVGAELANAAYAPDWRVEVGYANRREFSDMVMLQVGMDLPLFTRNRQDRSLASARATRDAASALWEDGRRRLEAELVLAHGDYERLRTRIGYYDETILPQTDAGIAAALAAWRSGSGTLVQVIDARRARIDAQEMRLSLVRDAAQRRVELDYLNGAEG
jgi:outer membrane protein, heavy metal efflux system